MSQTASPVVAPTVPDGAEMAESKNSSVGPAVATTTMPTTTSHATPQTPQLRTPTISARVGTRLASGNRTTTSTVDTTKRTQQSAPGFMYSTGASGYTNKQTSTSWYGGVHSSPVTHYTSTSGTSQGGQQINYYSGNASTFSSSMGRIGGSIRTEEGQGRILSERIVEHEVKVPKRVVVEELVEKVVIVPEKIVHEELIEEAMKIRERIIEIAKPIYQEKIVEVPEYEYVERLVEVPELIIQEKIKEVPRIEIQERIIEIPKIIVQEKIIEVPEIEYREVPIEKIVEVPEVREEIVYRQVPVPQYFDKPIPEYVNVEIEQDFSRSVPVPVEVITTVNFTLPKIRSRYLKVDLPIYVPRFVEVALPVDMADSAMLQQADSYSSHLQAIANSSASLCDVENLAYTLKSTDWNAMLNRAGENPNLFQQLWEAGQLSVDTSSFNSMAVSKTDTVSHPVETVNLEIREHEPEVPVGETLESELCVEETVSVSAVEAVDAVHSADEAIAVNALDAVDAVDVVDAVDAVDVVDASDAIDESPKVDSPIDESLNKNAEQEVLELPGAMVANQPLLQAAENVDVKAFDGDEEELKQRKKKSSKKDGEHSKRKKSPKPCADEPVGQSDPLPGSNASPSGSVQASDAPN